MPKIEATPVEVRDMVAYLSHLSTDPNAKATLAVGELGRIKIERLGSNGSDSMTGDAELMAVELKET